MTKILVQPSKVQVHPQVRYKYCRYQRVEKHHSPNCCFVLAFSSGGRVGKPFRAGGGGEGRPRRGASGGGRGGGGRGGGGRGGKREAKQPAPTREDLDNDLDAYLKAR